MQTGLAVLELRLKAKHLRSAMEAEVVRRAKGPDVAAVAQYSFRLAQIRRCRLRRQTARSESALSASAAWHWTARYSTSSALLAWEGRSRGFQPFEVAVATSAADELVRDVVRYHSGRSASRAASPPHL